MPLTYRKDLLMSYSSLSRRQIIRGAAGTFAALALGPFIPAAAKSAAQQAPITKPPIPSTGERLPVIGLGTNQYRVENPEDMARFQEVLAKMVALGGSVVDTARVYGRAEVVIGELMQRIGQRDRFVIMTILCLLLAVSAEAQSLVPLKGTRVSVAPPDGFVLAERFPGYMSDETGASIMVTEMQAPFAETIKGFDRNGFRKHGLTLLSRQGAVFGDVKGYIFSVSQEIEGVVILKWMAAFGDERTFYMVTAAFPEDHEAELSEPLKKSVLGARVMATQAQAEAGLTFRISEMHDMKIARVMGNNIIMSKGGVSPAKRMVTPILVAGASASKEMVISDRKAFAQAYLQKIPKMKGFKVRAEKAVTIDGLRRIGIGRGRNRYGFRGKGARLPGSPLRSGRLLLYSGSGIGAGRQGAASDLPGNRTEFQKAINPARPLTRHI